ncbi:MAG: type IV pilin protein [gamma proteobacterium symbiont of Bathyaustriella thionipta]|nr:type IV pilin protein [gamma proteobacterium symbiont of Bathyaustriella thionipta]MCU7949520.1 type IV pilin protein [gamma proteobacterium symbiont of Bathyaustriella thionipta]MCU7954155.1 type IV pilin protein [gamma proteobacterium symbiont of Bathyaustriella thionipta]MCU7956106.1 type IV pilin protein [gamma proteobacterium symbiont of Bathyaustriella thionipta]MCU7967568.1 type IV pilin protein [gamma proteobacterium symbiont of Bathyaustriella thionipta]
MKKNSGFTLIEILIVIAIIAILASIAVPSYSEFVARSKRADAQGALLGLAQTMERYFSENNTYCDVGAIAVGNCGTGAGDTGIPGIFPSQVPLDGGAAYYNLTISAVTASSFTLTASGVDSMATDKCGNFTLANTGMRGLTNNTDTVANCWK